MIKKQLMIIKLFWKYIFVDMVFPLLFTENGRS